MITAAAVRLPDGRIFEGRRHVEIWQAINAETKKIPQDFPDHLECEGFIHEQKEGERDATQGFVSRWRACQLAFRSGQLGPNGKPVGGWGDRVHPLISEELW